VVYVATTPTSSRPAGPGSQPSQSQPKIIVVNRQITLWCVYSEQTLRKIAALAEELI